MIDWNEIDTVLLDMDGTLLDLHFDNYFWLTHLPKRYAEAHDFSEAEALERLRHIFAEHEGTLNWYCLDFWSRTLEIDVRTLKEEVKHKIRVRPFAEEFLRQLHALDKRLVLITNAHPQSLDLKLQVTEIERWLHVVISSHEFKTPKEAREFWLLLQQREHFDPLRTLFIDDTVRILDSAHAFGIRHLLCMHQPDSQGQHRDIQAYPAIHHFDEILPQQQVC